MKLRVAWVSMVAFLAGAAPAAAGGALVTPGLFADTANVVCLVQNLGDTTTTATAHLYDADGDLVAENFDYPAYPGLNAPASGLNVTGAFYCVFEGLGKGLRGFISLNEGNQSVLVLPAGR